MFNYSDQTAPLLLSMEIPSVLEQEVIYDDDDAVSVGSDKSTSPKSSTDSSGLSSGDQNFTNRYYYILDGVNHYVLVGKNTSHSGATLSD